MYIHTAVADLNREVRVWQMLSSCFLSMPQGHAHKDTDLR